MDSCGRHNRLAKWHMNQHIHYITCTNIVTIMYYHGFALPIDNHIVSHAMKHILDNGSLLFIAHQRNLTTNRF